MERITLEGNKASLPPPSGGKPEVDGFGQRLKQAVEAVNDLQQDADTAAERVVSGAMGIHEGMLALSKAEISLRLLLQVRNKVMDAYREISRMSF